MMTALVTVMSQRENRTDQRVKGRKGKSVIERKRELARTCILVRRPVSIGGNGGQGPAEMPGAG